MISGNLLDSAFQANPPKVKLGIFGGTFDPPHLGHLILAVEACDQLELDRVLWVLTPNPPHKQGQLITSMDRRVEMLLAAISSNNSFELSRVDLDRPPPHYAVDTIRLLAAQFPGAELNYLIGGDSLRDLPTWHLPQQFLLSCDVLGVMRRPGAHFELETLEKQFPGFSRKIEYIDAPLIDISASMIRDRVRTGKPFRYFVPESVYHIILDRGLYLG